MNGKTVAVAMSGGVDSSVAAALCKQQGYTTIGITMKLWDGTDDTATNFRNSCYGPGETKTIESARQIADTIGIPHYVIDLSEPFRAEVLDYISRDYRSGRTPNPCIRCNRLVKFEALPRKVTEQGISFDSFATGHYCRVEFDAKSNRYLLKKGQDEKKDQSYFLAFLSQEQLERTLFPVGAYTKAEVRKLARDFGLDFTEKPESQDFIAAGYRSIIGETTPGTIRNIQGEAIGTHSGIANYTIGQRKGLGISTPEPCYVTDIDPDTGDITVGSKDDIYDSELTASALNWIGEQPGEPVELTVKIRYAHEAAAATITPLQANRVHIRFREPQMAITPGQAAVFYRGDMVVGAGIIERKGSHP